MTSSRATASIDLTSIASIIHALYASISGDAGVPRDWATFRSVYHPEARMMPTRPSDDGRSTVEVLDPEGYITSRSAHFDTTGFFEVEVGRREFRFGNIACVLSSYESRLAEGDAPFARGVNCFQLWWDGNRWWVMSVLWDNEREGVTLPDWLETQAPDTRPDV